MPELPEVETMVRDLRKPLIGRAFTGVQVMWSRTVQTGAGELQKRLPGQRLEAVERRGKYLVFRLSLGDDLLIHLRMTGDLQIFSSGDPLHKHDRVIFHLDNGYQLRFRDMRKFGRVYLTNGAAQALGHLGPEPLAPEFGEGDFLSRLERRSGRIKSLLLNQEFIAGLGNIYADEALFLAGIRPDRRANALLDEEKLELYHAIRQVLTRAIERKGSTLPDEAYRGGGYQHEFKVYGREDEPCLTCGNPIRRVPLNQRSAHFCPTCQR